MDSGATSHTTCRRDWLTEFIPQRRQVRLADEGVADITGKEIVKLRSHETGVIIKLANVLLVPNLRGNLISVRKILKNDGIKVVFDREKANVFLENEQLIAKAKLVGDFYQLQVDTLADEINQVQKETDIVVQPQ